MSEFNWPTTAIKDMVLDQEYMEYLKTPENESLAVSAEDRVTLNSETEWVDVAEPEPWPEDLRRSVGLHKTKCPRCNGKGEGKKRVRGVTTGVTAWWRTRCDCLDYKRFYPILRDQLPLGYREFRLDTLQPFLPKGGDPKIPVAVQKIIIKRVQENSGKSFLMTGPPGVSKTVLSASLFTNAVWEWVVATRNMPNPPEACWYISAFELVHQALEYITKTEQTYLDEAGNEKHRKAPEPLVTSRKIKAAAQADLKPRLFIEELDKIPNVTPHRASTIFEVTNVADAAKGQVVITSNLSPHALEVMYAIRDGEALTRRFSANNTTQDGITINFFELM